MRCFFLLLILIAVGGPALARAPAPSSSAETIGQTPPALKLELPERPFTVEVRKSSENVKEEALEREQRQTELSLQAASVQAAQGTFWISGLQTALTVIGTIVIVMSLREAKKATNHAAEATRQAAMANEQSWRAFAASERPWLVVVRASLAGPVFLNSEKFVARFEIAYKNVGKTVATHVNCSSIISIERRGSLMELLEALRQESIEQHEGLVESVVGQLLAPGEEIVVSGSTTLWVRDVLSTIPDIDQEIRPFLIGCLTYGNPVTGSAHQTGFSYIFVRRPDEAVIFDRARFWIDDGEIPSDQILVERFGAGHFAT
jgi:hypothetical protein